MSHMVMEDCRDCCQRWLLKLIVCGGREEKTSLKPVRYEGWDERPSGVQPLGANLSRQLSSAWGPDENQCLQRVKAVGVSTAFYMRNEAIVSNLSFISRD